MRDLTHVVSPRFPVLPFYQPLKVRDVLRIEQVGAASKELTINEHTGTHVDAPSHFIEDGRSIDQLRASELVAPLVVIRITERVAKDPIAELDVADVRRWERRHGRIPAGALVAMDSGWPERLGRPGHYLNQGSDGIMRFPGISTRAARLLTEGRDVAGVAVDTMSIDHGPALDFPTHRVVLGANRYAIENLANLDAVPDRGATAVVGASRHRNGTAGPARVLALI